MARLYADEQYPYPVVEILKTLVDTNEITGEQDPVVKLKVMPDYRELDISPALKGRGFMNSRNFKGAVKSPLHTQNNYPKVMQLCLLFVFLLSDSIT
jgi:hypothetical protein